jgi:Predicted oxidoreductases (related to aryl-alcohol dehydrogenases)
MDRVRLGRTGIEVGIAALGAGGKSKLGQTSGASFEHSVALVQGAIDAGVTLIDTAAAYGTEPIIGAAVKGRRDKVVISTKEMVYEDGTSPTGTDHLISAAELRRRLEASLKALGTDYVDLFHLHGIMPAQYAHCREVLVPEVVRFREEGLIRAACITERFLLDPKHTMLAEALKDDVFDVVMCGYNYLNQTASQSILPEAKARDIGTLCMYAVRGPLGRPEAVRALVATLIERGEIDAADVDPDNPLGFVTDSGAAASLTEAAYRFCRHTPGIDVVVTGTGNPHHLAENLRAINAGPLPEDVTARLRKIFARVWSETGEP